MEILRFDKHSGKLISKSDYIDQSLGGLPDVGMLGDIWERMPTQYDSEADTLSHIKRVNELLLTCCQSLLERAKRHDDSKLVEPEKSVFDIMTPKLRGLTYGSEEYKKSLAELGSALAHHYKNNSHHPEHYESGIDGMDLFDLLEMFCDWCAATERHSDGDILRSIVQNKERFGLSNQLQSILTNTAKGFYLIGRKP